jgi:hypothetical protein
VPPDDDHISVLRTNLFEQGWHGVTLLHTPATVCSQNVHQRERAAMKCRKLRRSLDGFLRSRREVSRSDYSRQIRHGFACSRTS